ncbi:MAG TPA: DUF4126 domain-containing protein [Coriobacteriia bacterium]
MELLTALGLAIPAGLNAYIPLLAVAVAQKVGWLQLREPYSLLGEWWAIVLIAVLLAVELVADKVPAVDHINDVIQTVIRPVAGGLLAIAVSPASSSVHPVLVVVAGVIVAGAVHAAKATTRPVVNTATAGFGAPVVSAIEDGVAAVTTFVALAAPYLVGLAVILLAVLFWRLWARKRSRGAAVETGG